MDKVQEFRHRAQECLDLATQASNGDLRGHYKGLARMWTKLAEERLAFFIKPEPK